jgi:3-oxoacyl-[acyl-carrier-protein] synthase II
VGLGPERPLGHRPHHQVRREHLAGADRGRGEGLRAQRAIDRKELKRLDLFSQYAMVAAAEAMTDAGLSDADLGPRGGVYEGSGIGGLGEITSGHTDFTREGPKGLTPFFIPKSLTNLAAGHIAMRWHAQGPSLAVSTACATGNHMIGEGWHVIRRGDADVIVAGGTEAANLGLAVAGFMVMKALSKRNDDPLTASRPFDRDRDGFVIGEGAGIVILEELEHARARGARIYAELVGYGLTNDAHHITAPAPGGEGAVRCMEMALRSGGVAPEEVDYINAHGTSTPANDSSETAAVKTVFGAHAHRLMMSSSKSMTGHLLGAAGGLEAVICAKAMQDGFIPPTANLENPDPECDLDYVAKVGRAVAVRTMMSNAFGFGGTNATIVMRRIEA